MDKNSKATRNNQSSIQSQKQQQGASTSPDLQEKIQQLEDENYCLRSILSHINEGIILTDRECRIRVFNPAKERMEHMTADDVMGQISWEAYPHSTRETSEHQKVQDTGKAIKNAYRPHAYADGVPIPIYYSTYPVKKNGEVIGVYTISRNETILRELLYETIEHKRSESVDQVKRQELIKVAKGTHYTFSDIIGNSPAMKHLIHEAQIAAPMNAPILITGETGVGKEVLAQSIHNYGREDKPFVAVNCAAIPENLVESVLFGTVRGAYTGALDKTGLLREAEDGTIFLDEINSMSTFMQAKLLRVLQERLVRPVGSPKEYPLRCRLICASNEEPEILISENRLRSDLFYRISGFCLSIPPLRERSRDAVQMARMFVKRYNMEFRRQVRSLSPELERWIASRPWYGNARELQNIIQNMMLRVDDTTSILGVEYIPSYTLRLEQMEQKNHSRTSSTLLHPEEFSSEESMDAIRENSSMDTIHKNAPTDKIHEDTSVSDMNRKLDRYQTSLIKEALRSTHGNVSRAAESLGIGRQNLLARMKRLNIRREDFLQ